MFNLNITHPDRLNSLLWEKREAEVDSPLTDVRVDETEQCHAKFGRVKVYFPSPVALEPVIEKTYDPLENIRQQSCISFQPEWKRIGDPYQGSTYTVQLVSWRYLRGNLPMSSDQSRILTKIISSSASTSPSRLE